MAGSLETQTPQKSVTDVNVCVSSAGASRPAPQKVTTLREWLVVNQLGVSITILAMIFAVHNLYPSLRYYTAPFLTLPHYQPAKDVYDRGLDDIYFVLGWTTGLMALRSFCIDWVFGPFARYHGLKPKASLRFAEQGWQLVYYSIFWTWGLNLWMNSKYWGDFREIWADWPSREISGTLKLYCLAQLSFWFQQIVVLHLEEKRKDHVQMLTHHVVTCSLLTSAYVYGFYHVSNVILCLMDIVDLLLPTAKMLKYMGYENVCNLIFGAFVIAWVASRHVIYNKLWWSIYQAVPEVMPYGTYSGKTGEMIAPDAGIDNWTHLFYPFFEIDGPICMSPRIKYTFLALLLCLQALCFVWFSMIMKIILNMLLSGKPAEDTRSDDENEEKSSSPAEDADIETTRATSSGASPPHHSVSIRTGRGRVALNDQNTRKELLGRIGCDKPT